MASDLLTIGESKGNIRNLVLAVTVEEYRALRAEVVNTVDRQYTLTNWSVSSIAILFAAIAGSWEHLRVFPNVIAAVVVFGVPIIGTIYAFAWTHVIEKIAIIGWYLHHIENKLTLLFTTEDIKQAFHRTSAPGDPYWYLFGWEHTLWLSTTQKYIERITKLVSGLLAVGYIGVVSGGVVILSHLGHTSTLSAMLKPIIIGSAILWLLVWAWLAHHLLVRTRMQKQRGAKGIADERAG